MDIDIFTRGYFSPEIVEPPPVEETVEVISIRLASWLRAVIGAHQQASISWERLRDEALPEYLRGKGNIVRNTLAVMKANVVLNWDHIFDVAEVEFIGADRMGVYLERSTPNTWVGTGMRAHTYPIFKVLLGSEKEISLERMGMTRRHSLAGRNMKHIGLERMQPQIKAKVSKYKQREAVAPVQRPWYEVG